MLKTALANEHSYLTRPFVLKPYLNRTFSYGGLSCSEQKILCLHDAEKTCKHFVKIAMPALP